MLFSNKQVASFLNDHFECAWQELRPVPKVRIDFGNGRVLQRTLAGNVATWICTNDGMSVDVIPALATVATYLARLKESLALHDELRNSKDPKRVLVAWHQKKSQATKQVLLPIVESRTIKAPSGLRFLSKSGVERPIKKSLLPNDNAYNRGIRDPLAHAILAQSAGAKPAQITYRLFREVLNVNLDDPYLDLAPYVLGGEVGRH